MEIKALTGLRGLAACYVVLFHFYRYLENLPTPLTNIVRHGYIAVDLFFVLSGFVMAYTYARLFKQAADWRVYATFLWKRFARIYPLYIVVFLITVFTWTATTPLTAYDLTTNLLLLQSWASDAVNPVLPSWSISTEVAAYLAFPLLLIPTVFLCKKYAIVSGAAAFSGLAAVALLSDPADSGGTNYVFGPLEDVERSTVFPLVRCFAGFTLGLLSYRVSRITSQVALGWMTNVSMVAILVLLAFKTTDLILVGLFSVLVVCLVTSDSLTSRILNTTVILWLGNISYSIYLTHVKVKHSLVEPIHQALEWLGVPHPYSFAYFATFVVVLAVSTIFFYAVEKPGRLILRRSRSIEPQASAH